MGKMKDIATQAQEYGIDITDMSVSQVLELLQDIFDFEDTEEEPEEFTDYVRHTKPTTEVKSDMDNLLDSRAIYGSFKEKAEWIQGGKQAMRTTPKWEYLGTAEREALDNIMQKIGCILYEEPRIGNWSGIIMYATLVEEYYMEVLQ